VTVRGPDQRPLSTTLLVTLAFTLPMLALLSSQLRIYCIEQGECFPLVQVGAWLLVPLMIAWVVVILVLALRGGRLMLTRRRSHSRG
jgi:hypothetical protein